jgi:nucleoside-diphosphate-sugar epimerase
MKASVSYCRVMKKLKVLITGANGFVGNFITTQLESKYDLLTPSSKELDLTNLVQVENWFTQNEVDVVVHCALSGREVLSSTDPKYLSDGLLMFRNLWLQKEQYTRFVNLGTAYEFDLTKNNNKILEHDFLYHLPKTSYGYAKNVAARIIKDTPGFYNLKLFGVFHETESLNRFFQKVKHQDEVVIYNDIYLDYMYLPDILPMLELMIQGHSQHSDVNMVYSHKYRLSDMAEILCEHLALPLSKIKIINPTGNNLTGDSVALSSYKFSLIGLEQGLRNYK